MLFKGHLLISLDNSSYVLRRKIRYPLSQPYNSNKGKKQVFIKVYNYLFKHKLLFQCHYPTVRWHMLYRHVPESSIGLLLLMILHNLTRNEQSWCGSESMPKVITILKANNEKYVQTMNSIIETEVATSLYLWWKSKSS